MQYEIEDTDGPPCLADGMIDVDLEEHIGATSLLQEFDAIGELIEVNDSH